MPDVIEPDDAQSQASHEEVLKELLSQPTMPPDAPIASTGPQNPFAAAPVTVTSSPPGTGQDPPADAPEVQIQLEELYGRPIPPQRFFQLEQAFKQANLPKDQPVWVYETPHDIQVVCNPLTQKPVKTPEEAGYQQVQAPLKLAVNRTLGFLAAWTLGCKIQGDWLYWPNGARLPLASHYWVDHQGQRVQLYLTRALPDGTWLKVNDVVSVDRIPLSNQKAIRIWLEGRISQLETTGKVRDYPPVPTSSANIPQPTATQPMPQVISEPLLALPRVQSGKAANTAPEEPSPAPLLDT